MGNVRFRSAVIQPCSLAAALALGPLHVRAEAPPAAEAPQPEASPRFFVTVMASTTLASRPAGSSLSGPSRDVSPMVGLGYLLSDTWALELDAGPSFLPDEGYTSFSLVPGVVYTFHPNFYAAARVTVPFHPAWGDVIAAPGIGATVALPGNLAPYLEASALGWAGEGGLDVGAGITAGVSLAF